MKKIPSVMAAFLIAVLALSLTACTGRDSRQPTISSQPSVTTAPYTSENGDEAETRETDSRETKQSDGTPGSETDPAGEGVMDGIADDVRDGMDHIKDRVSDRTEPDSSAETQNR